MVNEMSGIIETRARRIAMDGVRFNANPERFAHYKSHLATIGQIAITYSDIEQFLAFFCAYLLGQTGPPKRYGHPVNVDAIKIVTDMRSRSPQEKYLRKLVKERLGVDSWEPLARMLKLVDVAAGDRNFLLHTPIQVSDQHPGYLIACPLTDDGYLLDDAILGRILDAVREARNAVQFAHNEARKHLDAQVPNP
jgi:hypothetical protein